MEEEKAARAAIDKLCDDAIRLIIEGKLELALPKAIKAMEESIRLHGKKAPQLLPIFLLLAEINLRLGNQRYAEDVLSQANWIAIKRAENCGHSTRSQLHRKFGKLYIAQGKYEEALSNLATDVYSSSLDVGPEHVSTAEGYYLLGNVFYALNDIESALAFYDKVVDIWFRYLADARMGKSDLQPLTEMQCFEALNMMTNVLNVRNTTLGDAHIATGEARYTLGLLQILVGQPGYNTISLAFQVYIQVLGPDHPSTKDVEGVLVQLEKDLNLAAGPQSAGLVVSQAES